MQDLTDQAQAAALPAWCDKLLSRPGLLQGIDAAVVARYLGDCEVRQLKLGEVLIDPSQMHENLFVVIEGALGVHLRGLEEPAIAILGPGECAGEMSVIDREPPSAFVLAEEPTGVLVVPADTVWAMVAGCPVLARNLLYTLARRVRVSNGVIVETMNSGTYLDREARTDALTGLFSRRWLELNLPRELTRSLQAQLPLCLLSIEPDNFGFQIETGGAAEAERVLRRTAAILQERLRPRDSAARFGDGEFVVVMPDTDPDTARRLAERIRTSVSVDADPITGEISHAMSVSIGVAALGAADDAATLLARAATARREAATTGNSVRSAEQAHPPR